MNQDLSYQNRDASQLNPLAPAEKSVPPADDKSTPLPINPKIKILIILGIIIVILLITSLIVSLVKKSVPSPPAITSTSTPSSILTPTDTPNSALPSKFQEKFTQIDHNNQTEISFPPPQIDPSVGL
jgi:hypothetical protein